MNKTLVGCFIQPQFYENMPRHTCTSARTKMNRYKGIHNSVVKEEPKANVGPHFLKVAVQRKIAKME